MTTMRCILLLAICLTGSRTRADELYFRFLVSQKSDLDRLNAYLSIDQVRGDTVFAYASSGQLESFRSLGYAVVVLPHPGSEYEHVMASSCGEMLDWDRYPTYQAYVTMMRDYAAQHPDICRLDTVGRSGQNRLLLALCISDNVNTEEDEPEGLYTSSIHGDETVGYILLLRLADYLLSKYGEDTPEGQRVTDLVNGMEIWITPLANPDGTYWGGDTTVTGARRGNRNGTDLNRDFPDRIADTVNTGVGREIETRVAMEFARAHNITVSANFHGGAQVVNYPWDNGTPSGTYSTCPDDAWFIQFSRAYASTNPDLLSGGFTNGITNGCQWYSIYGGRQDWIYWWHGGRETTIELWNTKNPPGSTLPQRWTNNKESLLSYLEEGLKGIGGIVTSAQTGQPLKARVTLQGLPTVPVFTDSAAGDYHRPVKAGTYTILVQAEGYRPDTVRNIVVTGGPATRADVALDPLGTGVETGEPGAPETISLLQNYPNPFNGETEIRFRVPGPALPTERSAAMDQSSGQGSRVALGVYDLLGRRVAVLVDEVLSPGDYARRFDAGNLGSGVYLYRLTTAAGTVTRKMTFMK